jgi:hypothetical protein
MFQPIVEKLMNIAQCFHKNLIQIISQLNIIEEFGCAFGIGRKPSIE